VINAIGIQTKPNKTNRTKQYQLLTKSGKYNACITTAPETNCETTGTVCFGM
jgi:hypothetical protein